MASKKRQRERERARYEAWQRRRQEQAAARRRRLQAIGAVVTLVVVVAGVAVFALTNRGDGDGEAVAQPSASPSSQPAAGCSAPVTPTAKTQTWDQPPADTVKPGTTYRITLTTNCGDIVIESTPKVAKAAPRTVSAQQFLAQQGFFDASDCFRLTTSDMRVLQCGSPDNDGGGGPGYTLPDENLPKAGTGNYPAGTVAMANAGPGTGGSQFFLVYEDTTLDPDYPIWGTVVSGLDVLRTVAEQGVHGGGSDGRPVQPLVITKATTSTSTGSSG